MSDPETPPTLPSPSAAPLTLSIAAVERDVGLSKDTLRVWERRYGFPQPLRDGSGERCYPLEQVDRLRLIKRLLDAGHRPGRTVGLPPEDLARLESRSAALRPPVDRPSIDENAVHERLRILRAHDPMLLRRVLGADLMRLGLRSFVLEWMPGLNEAVGQAWLRGQLQVFEEHLYTEAMQSLLYRAIALLPDTGAARPRIVLATLPGEPHALGLLAAQALLTLEGAACVPLGAQLPAWDLVAAAEAFEADIVAVGLSGCTPPNPTQQTLRELRQKLPATVGLWIGGAGSAVMRRGLERVQALPRLADLPPALQSWRSEAENPSEASGA